MEQNVLASVLRLSRPEWIARIYGLNVIGDQKPTPNGW